MRKLQPAEVSQAARILFDARMQRKQIEELPANCAPATTGEGYEIQREVIRLVGERVAGWKVGCTTKESQDRASTNEPFSGPIFERDLYHDGDEVPASAYSICALQVEFAFRLGSTLPAEAAPFQLSDVQEAIAQVLPAIEIADSRFIDPARISAPGLIADGGKAGVFVVGNEGMQLADVDVIEQEVRLSVNGAVVACGHGRDVLGDPIKSVQWLANSMAARGESLVAGQIVSSGTCTGSFYGQPGDAVIADYGRLGKLEVRLTP